MIHGQLLFENIVKKCLIVFITVEYGNNVSRCLILYTWACYLSIIN